MSGLQVSRFRYAILFHSAIVIPLQAAIRAYSGDISRQHLITSSTEVLGCTFQSSHPLRSHSLVSDTPYHDYAKLAAVGAAAGVVEAAVIAPVDAGKIRLQAYAPPARPDLYTRKYAAACAPN